MLVQLPELASLIASYVNRIITVARAQRSVYLAMIHLDITRVTARAELCVYLDGLGHIRIVEQVGRSQYFLACEIDFWTLNQ